MSMLSHLRFVPAALALATALLMPAAKASVVFFPPSIVTSADGTYITDTANNRDWYKFSNAQSTVGLSLNEVSSLFAGTGWSLASLNQVQALQGQFGWTADTTSGNTNVNFGLTAAMGAYLGFTTNYLAPHPDGTVETGNVIQAMIGSFVDDKYFTTMSYDSSFVDLGLFSGDYVNGMFSLQDPGQRVTGVGTWLSRVHVSDTGGGGPADPDCSPLAPCAGTLPEPASYTLVMGALLAVGAAKRRARQG